MFPHSKSGNAFETQHALSLLSKTNMTSRIASFFNKDAKPGARAALEAIALLFAFTLVGALIGELLAGGTGAFIGCITGMLPGSIAAMFRKQIFLHRLGGYSAYS